MPAKSEKQQHAAGMAYAAKQGKIPMAKLRGAVKEMAQSMSETQLHDFASKKADAPAPCGFPLGPELQAILSRVRVRE